MKKPGIVLLAMAAAALGLAAFAACGLAACNDTGDTPGGDTPGGNVPGGNAGNEYLVFETLADGSLQVSADSGKEMPEEIVIPSEYEGKPVTAVKAQGFALNRAQGLERVVIPEGVKSIGENAFYNLNTLESAVLPDSLIEMGMYAFAGCAALQDIEFGSGLSVIPVGAFGGCAIASLTLPETVTDIYYDAFRGCRELTSVTLPDSVTYLGSSVFAECEALTEVTLPKGLTAIENATFRACGSLAQIEIPAGVKSIGSSAFDGCALKEIALPEGVASIGNEAFKDCAFEEIAIPKSVTTIEADDILEKKGVVLVPDILANAGGVVVSYFEWVQNLQALEWEEQDVNDKLAKNMRKAFDSVYAIAEKKQTTLRMGAYLIALKRVVETTQFRGIWP